MKVVLSARVEADILHQLQYGIDTFGQATAQRTFARVDRLLNVFLPAHPRTGRRIAEPAIFES